MSYLVYSEYNKRLLNTIKNKNFLNNQNYVISKKIINHILSIKNVKENNKNMIGYNSYLVIQEINFNLIKNKRNNLKFFLFGFFLLFMLLSFWGFIQGDQDAKELLIFGPLFFIPFIFFFLYSSVIFRGSTKIYRNKDKIIFYNKSL